MERSEFEQFLRDFYRARLANDLERCLAFFTPESTFQMVGTGERAPAEGAKDAWAALRDQVAELIAAWDWKAQEFHDLILDGDRAAVRYRLTTIFRPSGERVTTEIVDVLRVSGRKVLELHHFVDTAAVESIVARHIVAQETAT
jgi:ketosteroid isomerase-like protein